MELNATELQLALTDRASNYLVVDQAAAARLNPPEGEPPRVVLVADVVHLEMDLPARLVLRIPLHLIPAIADQFNAVESDLRSKGAIT